MKYIETKLEEHKSGDFWEGLIIKDVSVNGSNAGFDTATYKFQVKEQKDQDTVDLEITNVTFDGTDLTVPGQVVSLNPHCFYWELLAMFTGDKPKRYFHGTWPIIEKIAE